MLSLQFRFDKIKRTPEETFKQAAIIAAFWSDDLSMIDRCRDVQAVKDEIREVEGQGLGAVGGEPRDLEKLREVR